MHSRGVPLQFAYGGAKLLVGHLIGDARPEPLAVSRESPGWYSVLPDLGRGSPGADRSEAGPAPLSEDSYYVAGRSEAGLTPWFVGPSQCEQAGPASQV